MVIVYRALTSLSDGFAASSPIGRASVEEYPDIADVAPYAEDAVKALITAELISGKNGYIEPKSYTTRAEVAVLLKRILDLQNK